MTETVMQGGGYYNAHSELQSRAAGEGDAFLDEAVAAIALPPEGPIWLADFGASQGHNAMHPIGRALAGLEGRAGPGRHFVVAHTDQPHNDFTALFETLEAAPDSYRPQHPSAFPVAIGRSFYEQLLPDGCLSLGWSSFAAQWLSATPARIADGIWFGSGTPEEKAAFARHAAADWTRFLLCRARELHAGGQLLLVVPARDAAGQSGIEGVMAAAEGVLAALQAEGRLAAEDVAAMTVPVHPREEAEFAAAFTSGAMPELRLDRLTIAHAPHPLRERWLADGDAGALGEAMAGFFRAAFGPTLFGGDTAIATLFTARLAAVVRENPAPVVADPLAIAFLRITRL